MKTIDESYEEEQAITKFLHIELRLFEALQKQFNCDEQVIFYQQRMNSFPHKSTFKTQYRDALERRRCSLIALNAIQLQAKIERYDFHYIKGDEVNFKLLHSLYAQLDGERIND